MSEGVIAGWDNFFVGQLGAAAALGGLVFVAISINLDRILAYKHLPQRAVQAMVKILASFLVSSAALIPNQPGTILGLESGVIGAVLVLVTLRAIALEFRDRKHSPLSWWLPGFSITLVAAAPFLIGGVFLILGVHAGIYWIAAAVVISLVACILDAWVLLVEIKR